MKKWLIFVLQKYLIHKIEETMKDKLLYNQIDVVLQSLAFIAFVIGLFLGNMKNEWEMIPVVAFFTFAALQLLGSLFIGFKFDDKRRKLYLKVFLYIQVIGSLLIALLFQVSGDAGFFLFGLIWIVAPFFMAIWCYVNSWKGIKDAQREMSDEVPFNQEILDEEMTRNKQI